MRYLTHIFISVFLVAISLVPAMSVSAIDLGTGMAKNAAVEAGFAKETTDTTLAEIAGGVVQSILSFVGIIFMVLIIYAGFLWMTARGEEDAVNRSKKIIFQSIVGLIIVVGAYSITSLVLPLVLERSIQ